MQQIMQDTDFERRWVEAPNRGDIAAADETFTPDCVIHITGSPEPDLSLEGFKQMVAGLLAAFPDLHFTIEDQLVSGDKVVTRWTAGGTNTARPSTIPASAPVAASQRSASVLRKPAAKRFASECVWLGTATWKRQIPARTASSGHGSRPGDPSALSRT